MGGILFFFLPILNSDRFSLSLFIFILYFWLFWWDFGREAGWEVQCDGLNVCRRMEVFLALSRVSLEKVPFSLEIYEKYNPLLSSGVPPVWGTRTFSLSALCSFLGSLLKTFWISWFCLPLSHNFSLIIFFPLPLSLGRNFEFVRQIDPSLKTKLLSPLCSS